MVMREPEPPKPQNGSIRGTHVPEAPEAPHSEASDALRLVMVVVCVGAGNHVAGPLGVGTREHYLTTNLHMNTNL